MILHNRVILPLISLHVAHDFVLKLPKVILECLIERRDLLFERVACQVIMPETILDMAKTECRVRPL